MKNNELDSFVILLEGEETIKGQIHARENALGICLAASSDVKDEANESYIEIHESTLSILYYLKVSGKTFTLKGCSWGEEFPVRTESTHFENSGSINYSNGRHGETFGDIDGAVAFAKKKAFMPDDSSAKYWNDQDEVITKVTVIKEVVRIVRSDEKR